MKRNSFRMIENGQVRHSGTDGEQLTPVDKSDTQALTASSSHQWTNQTPRHGRRAAHTSGQTRPEAREQPEETNSACLVSSIILSGQTHNFHPT
ncbi:hypothetical protein RRG08_016320 [Elysia crispata]|uniref:Uncharacterized protein n=1 Tax=Elysia crispata TaxID=231223 RepID=A0AAE1AWY5_9GAST|nr:hypothetical protein RRG08_016320 [Elysia crispata]